MYEPVALAAEYLRTGGLLSELFTAQRVMNTLLMQAGLDSYEINFNNLSRRNYRLGFLSGVLANLNNPKYNIIRIEEGQKSFWPVSLLVEDFSLQPNDPRLVRFFIRDLQYLLMAIHYVLPEVWEGRFIGSSKDVVNSCIPLEQHLPNLDPTSIVHLYQMDLLSYLMRPEVEAWLGD